MAYDYKYFKGEVLKLTQINLDAYKEQQMKRRIDTLIRKLGISGYDNYIAAIKSDKKLFDEFVTYLTINVSEFYRNPEQWKLLEDNIFPQLIQKFGNNLKIWSAACSTGEEPYSLVMALSKFVPIDKITIYATDLDKQVIEKAKIGLYDVKSIENVPAEYKQKYFTKLGESYKIDEKIKSRVVFQQHNLLEDDYRKDLHLIVCRNVLIYFTEDSKNEIIMKFHKALSKEGILFLGNTEQLIQYKSMGYARQSSFYYEKL